MARWRRPATQAGRCCASPRSCPEASGSAFVRDPEGNIVTLAASAG
jgi:hypothetical protein